jgi:hypothetical protein
MNGINNNTSLLLVVAFKKAVVYPKEQGHTIQYIEKVIANSNRQSLTYCHCHHLLLTIVFGDGLGSFRYGVLGKFSWEDQTNRGLDFPRSNGRSLVVSSQLGGFMCNALKDIIDKRVHDGHSLAGDVDVWVALT